MRDGFVKVAAGTPAIKVADPAYNAKQIIALMKQAARKKVDILCLPELCLTGATCGDLFLQPALLEGAEDALIHILRETREVDVVTVVGLPFAEGGKVYNCAAVIQNGGVPALVPKATLSAAERRWFAPGRPYGPASLEGCGDRALFGTDLVLECESVPGLTIGVAVGNDLGAMAPASQRLLERGATVILNPYAAPALVTRADYLRTLIRARSASCVCGYVCAGAGEGESTGEAVYGGHDMIAENGVILAESRFETGLVISELDIQRLNYARRWESDLPAVNTEGDRLFTLPCRETVPLTRPVEKNPFVPADPAERAARCEDILNITARGLKTRLEHIGCPKAVIGLSGGLDSTLALLIIARAYDLMGRSHKEIVAFTLPCFGTSDRTKSNAWKLAKALGVELREVDIGPAVTRHFQDIGQDPDRHDAAYENAQARERTQVLMDVANQVNGIVVGTGDLSELALGWCTYNGDQMSMYGVNASIPKTLIRGVVGHVAATCGKKGLRAVLEDILDTPVSPELLPARDGKIAQKTEDIVGPYELHDFFLYYILRCGFPPGKVYRLAKQAFKGEYAPAVILKWLKNFYRRFFTQQFKRGPSPDGPRVGSVGLGPKDWQMPSDVSARLWLEELESL